jgi:hypothetical protein
MGKKRGNIRLVEWVNDTDYEEVDFKKLCSMKKKDIQAIDNIPRIRGRYVISSRKAYVDLADYNNNPDIYTHDIEVLSRDIKFILTDPKFKEMYLDFCYTESDKIHRMSHVHFLLNMIMWKPFFALGLPINKSRVFMPKTWTNRSYVAYINDNIIEPLKHKLTHNQMSSLLADMYDSCIKICELSGILMGISFSLRETLLKWNECPELDDICHTKLDTSLQISEAENYLAAQTKRMKELYMTEECLDDTSLKALLRSEVVNEKQLREFFIHIG